MQDPEPDWAMCTTLTHTGVSWLPMSRSTHGKVALNPPCEAPGTVPGTAGMGRALGTSPGERSELRIWNFRIQVIGVKGRGLTQSLKQGCRKLGPALLLWVLGHSAAWSCTSYHLFVFFCCFCFCFFTFNVHIVDQKARP